MNKTHVLSLLGLAFKASKLVTGEEMSLVRIKSKKAYLVFLASNAGPNTTKRVTDKCAFYNITLLNLFTSDEISNAIGKDNRMVIAITDFNFAKLIERAINE